MDSVNPFWNHSLQTFFDTTTLTAGFEWHPTCNLLKDASVQAKGYPERTFTFIVRAEDNWCPVPYITAKLFTITLVDTSAYFWDIDTMDAAQGGAYVHWPEYTSPGFSSYEVYRKSNTASPWTYLTSISNASTNFYKDASAPTNLYPVYYKVFINNSGSNCSAGFKLRTVNLKVQNAGNFPYLQWNCPIQDTIPLFGKYYIYRQDNSGIWKLLDSVNLSELNYFNYVFPFDVSMNFKIVAKVNGTISISNVETLYIKKPPDPVPGFEEFNLGSVHVFPNPFRDELTIRIPGIEENCRVEIIDALGAIINSSILTKEINHIDLSQIKPGLYYLKFADQSGNMSVRKIVKEN